MINPCQALRSLSKTPLVTAVAVLSLALGIGAYAAIFSIFEQRLLLSASFAFLAAVAFTAGLLPAYRAARVDPMRALRDE